MGTWGLGPFDNDDAADMVAGLTKHVQRVAENKRGGDYNSARAASQFLLLSHGTDILGGPGLAPVARALARMRMDRDWLAGWNSPRKIAAALDRELLAVESKMALCPGCRKSIDKSEARELATLIQEARGQKVPKSTRSKRRVSRTTKATVRRLLRTKAPASRR